MSGEDERGFVKAMYPGLKWHQRVERMSDAQVHAIYMREKESPKNDKKDSKEES